MYKSKSLVDGIGNYEETNKYYNKWALTYDQTLSKWNYSTPKKAARVINRYIDPEPRNILDLACGTGLFGEKLIKIYPKTLIDGIDISNQILDQARKKNIYKNLYCNNFDKNFFFLKKKYDLVSCIGAMTYTKNPKNLILNIHKIAKSRAFFIFSHRVDLWKKDNFDVLLFNLSSKWKKVYISRPLLYLPKNNDFSKKIKIKICLLSKR